MDSAANWRHTKLPSKYSRHKFSLVMQVEVGSGQLCSLGMTLHAVLKLLQLHFVSK